MTRKSEAADPLAAKSAMYWPQLLVYRGFDADALLAGQQRAVEAWIAASQRLIEGMQELFKRQLLLQSALIERSFASAASFAQLAVADGQADEMTRAAQTAMEGTVEALRNTIDASCKCSMDVMTVFRDRMVGRPDSGSAACETEAPTPTTSEVITARERPGETRASVSREAAST